MCQKPGAVQHGKFHSWGGREKRGAGIDSIHLFSIKLFMASIRFCCRTVGAYIRLREFCILYRRICFLLFECDFVRFKIWIWRGKKPLRDWICQQKIWVKSQRWISLFEVTEYEWFTVKWSSITPREKSLPEKSFALEAAKPLSFLMLGQ